MLDLYISRADITEGQDILDLGCRWGSVALHVAAKFPNSRVSMQTGKLRCCNQSYVGGQDRGNKFIDLPREPFYEPSYGGNTIFLSFIPSTYLGIYLEGLNS